MPNGFKPETPFEQYVYDKFEVLPCEKHEGKIEENSAFRNKAIGAYIVLGCLIGGGIFGLLWSIYRSKP